MNTSQISENTIKKVSNIKNKNKNFQGKDGTNSIINEISINDVAKNDNLKYNFYYLLVLNLMTSLILINLNLVMQINLIYIKNF